MTAMFRDEEKSLRIYEFTCVQHKHTRNGNIDKYVIYALMRHSTSKQLMMNGSGRQCHSFAHS